MSRLRKSFLKRALNARINTLRDIPASKPKVSVHLQFQLPIWGRSNLIMERERESIPQSDLFSYLGVRWFVNNTLPMPGIQDNETQIKYVLLPCSVAKQNTYPDFVGYLKSLLPGEEPCPAEKWPQTGINTDPSSLQGFSISGPHDVRQIEAVAYLVQLAKHFGHKFPKNVGADPFDSDMPF